MSRTTLTAGKPMRTWLLLAVPSNNKQGVRTSIRDGGTLIEYEDEDPQMQNDFDAALKKTGVSMEIPQCSYVGI